MNSAQPRSNNRSIRITVSAAGIFLISLILFFGLRMLHAPGRTVMQCKRATNECQLMIHGQNKVQSMQIRLNTLTGARVAYPTHTDTSSDYQVYLYAAGVNYPVATYKSLSSADDAKQKIIDFIKDKSRAEFVLGQSQDSLDTAAWVILVIMSLVVAGMLLSAWRKPRTRS
ncbi:MAG: hypothetical protein KGL13_02560 [Gammaproteobacteria bacterium]|nr:hypothetical protein [Gammaproteobacteria bacterium]MDE2345328.1 hypothetical protein [Gammaproteobacteria bacterium]